MDSGILDIKGNEKAVECAVNGSLALYPVGKRGKKAAF